MMSFVTLAYAWTAETIEKKSRFIASAFPIRSEAEAFTALDGVREDHPDARHHVYAYRIGIQVPSERFSDDGEPSGTAGRPVLEVIRRKGLTNVLVVVTRYFGGILLGASGLVRAYTEAAAAVLEEAPKLLCAQMCDILVSCAYEHYGKLMHLLEQTGLRLYDAEFTEAVRFRLVVRETDVPRTVALVTDATSGQATCRVSPPAYVGVTDAGELVRNVWLRENVPE
ncbi:IMPACT family protein [Alicyclobacillus mali (ex Roth et al. 2021)]|uniref:IMPACT family protein n=1 Tax=Alicyclobacillus mali (ex Roth et al. 2021) TaxID=1123961 RepID=UPI000831D88D|nr:YigZ family protein [Alicyclobacillus mali (ex Roth et al. 2021)]